MGDQRMHRTRPFAILSHLLPTHSPHHHCWPSRQNQPTRSLNNFKTLTIMLILVTLHMDTVYHFNLGSTAQHLLHSRSEQRGKNNEEPGGKYEGGGWEAGLGVSGRWEEEDADDSKNKAVTVPIGESLIIVWKWFYFE